MEASSPGRAGRAALGLHLSRSQHPRRSGNNKKQLPWRLAGPLLDSIRGSSVPPTEPHPTTVEEPYPGASLVHRLVDEYRSSCLWFLRRDYYPESPAAALRVLRDIERYGDRTAFQRAAEVRQWLSQNSSAGLSAL